MVATKKVRAKENLSKALKSSKSAILFDLDCLPSKQLHEIRNKLKADGINTFVAKRRILERAAKEAKTDLKLDGLVQPAIVYSDKEIFEVVKALKSLKTKRKAKTGEKAQEDISVPTGDTGVQAGPAISTFKQFNIQTMMKDGKIGIREEKVVCEKDGEVSIELVSLLNMLGIEPVEMSIAPQGGFSDGLSYTKDVFDIDKAFLESQISSVANNMFKMTCGLGYPTNKNSSLLLTRGFGRARALGMKYGIPSKNTIEDLLRVANGGAKRFEK